MIRPYLKEDRAACLQIFKSNCPEYFDKSELADFKLWLDGQDEQKIVYRNSKAEKYFVIVQDGKVIGCGGYYIFADKPSASMAWGMIHNNFHKQGLGQQLFQFRLNEIQKTYPNHQISLDTSQHTFRFFERFGFQVTKITPDGYGSGMDKYDMIK